MGTRTWKAPPGGGGRAAHRLAARQAGRARSPLAGPAWPGHLEHMPPPYRHGDTLDDKPRTDRPEHWTWCPVTTECEHALTWNALTGADMPLERYTMPATALRYAPG